MTELNLLIARNEGALIRVLGTIERRGFSLQSLSTTQTAQGLRLTITLDAAERAPEVLLRQLRRLIDVREASMELPKPAFRLPPLPARAANAAVGAAGSRRGFSFLGIPERVSDAGAVFA